MFDSVSDLPDQIWTLIIFRQEIKPASQFIEFNRILRDQRMIGTRLWHQRVPGDQPYDFIGLVGHSLIEDHQVFG